MLSIADTTKANKVTTQSGQTFRATTPSSSGLTLHSTQNEAIDWPPQEPRGSRDHTRAKSGSVTHSALTYEAGRRERLSNTTESHTSDSQQSAPKSPVKSAQMTSHGARQAADHLKPSSSSACMEGDAQSITPSSSQLKGRDFLGGVLKDITSPSQDPWQASPLQSQPTPSRSAPRESTHNQPSPSTPPTSNQRYHAPNLNDPITTATYNAWKESSRQRNIIDCS